MRCPSSGCFSLGARLTVSASILSASNGTSIHAAILCVTSILMVERCLPTNRCRWGLRELISRPAGRWDCTSSAKDSPGASTFASYTSPTRAYLRPIRALTPCRCASALESLRARAVNEWEPHPAVCGANVPPAFFSACGSSEKQPARRDNEFIFRDSGEDLCSADSNRREKRGLATQGTRGEHVDFDSRPARAQIVDADRSAGGTPIAEKTIHDFMHGICIAHVR